MGNRRNRLTRLLDLTKSPGNPPERRVAGDRPVDRVPDGRINGWNEWGAALMRARDKANGVWEVEERMAKAKEREGRSSRLEKLLREKTKKE